MKVTTDNQWFNDAPEMRLYSSDRPHLFYAVQMDCDANFERIFSYNPMSMPRVSLEWTMLNDGSNHFSYEEMGSLRLSFVLLCLQVFLSAFVIVSYIHSIRQTERYLSPHPILLSSLAVQVWS